MVTATHGALIQGDVALIEFIRSLDSQQPPGDRVIIEEHGNLGDRALFIKESKVQWVKEKVEEWQQSLRFEPKAAQA